jgi:hypothetical protein
VKLAVEAEGILSPQPLHEHNLLLEPSSLAIKWGAECVVLDLVPADADAEAEPVARQHRDLSRLLRSEGCLALGQHHHRSDELNTLRDCGEKAVEHEWLMKCRVGVIRTLETTRTIAFGAEHMVVDHQMTGTEFLGTLGEGTNRARISTDLVMWDDNAELHS